MTVRQNQSDQLIRSNLTRSTSGKAHREPWAAHREPWVAHREPWAAHRGPWAARRGLPTVIMELSRPQCQPNQTHCTAGEALLTLCAGLWVRAQYNIYNNILGLLLEPFKKGRFRKHQTRQGDQPRLGRAGSSGRAD